MKKKYYLVRFEYQDGENCYLQTSFFRATKVALERDVNGVLEDFVRGRVERWRVDSPVSGVLEFDQQRMLSVEAEEVRTVDGRPVWPVNEL